MAKKPANSNNVVKTTDTGRKIFYIEEYKNALNTILRESVTNPDIRKGIMASMEVLLHSTGCYKGYRFLTIHEVPRGHLPGIRVNANGEPLEYDYRFLDTDSTRVQYY